MLALALENDLVQIIDNWVTFDFTIKTNHKYSLGICLSQSGNLLLVGGEEQTKLGGIF